MKAKKHLSLNLRIPLWWPDGSGWRRVARALVPNPGTLIILVIFLLVQNAGALPLRAPALAGDSTTTISYQGRLADSAGNPITTSGIGMQFCLYDTDVSESPEWCEDHPSVPVEDGLFSVLLGNRSGGIPIDVLASNPTLWLGITVGSDSEMTPREQIASAPYATLASTVPDGSVTTAKLADGAVSEPKMNFGSYARFARGAASPEALNLIFGDGTGWRFRMKRGDTEATLLEVADTGGMLLNGNLTATGNVGIGGPSPGNALHVAPGRTIRFDLGSGQKLSLGGEGSFEIDAVGIVGGRFVVTDGGNVGIGTTNPGAKLDVNGDFRATGTKSAIVEAGGFGQRKLYASESPEVRFFDEGLARLKEGIARVVLDPVFLETIEGDYLVHVTPYGDASLYVDEISKGHFVVKVRDGDPNVAFAWRLSAHRRGYAGVRLEQAEDMSPSAEQGPTSGSDPVELAYP